MKEKLDDNKTIREFIGTAQWAGSQASANMA